uniref:Putative secreted peptide n=1 Tax=Anopheles braziliensis TaxID=58242 RepID=A0A2M3ZX99_9DIPT
MPPLVPLPIPLLLPVLSSDECRWLLLPCSEMSSKAGGGVEEQEGDVPSQIRNTKRLSFLVVFMSMLLITTRKEGEKEKRRAVCSSIYN